MPTGVQNYQNGKIYKIWSLLTHMIYIGSTCDTLSNRLCKHKKDYNYWKKNGKGSYTSSFVLFDLVGIDNCKIELEHNFACDSKTKLNREEGRVQRLYKDIILNKNEAGRTKKEYDEEHKQEIKDYMKEYRQQHKEEIKEYYKQYKQEHKEEIKEYREEHKEILAEKAKEYYQEHKEVIAEKAKEYRQNHKEKINKKCNCECGGYYSHKHKSTHEKSNKHQKYIQSSSSSLS